MLADSAGLFLALAAATIARRPANSRRTFGYARAEVLAVLSTSPSSVSSPATSFEAIRRLGRGAPELDYPPGHRSRRRRPRGQPPRPPYPSRPLPRQPEHPRRHPRTMADAWAPSPSSSPPWPSLSGMARHRCARRPRHRSPHLPRALTLLRQSGSISWRAPPRPRSRCHCPAQPRFRGLSPSTSPRLVHCPSSRTQRPVELTDAGCTEHVLTDLAASSATVSASATSPSSPKRPPSRAWMLHEPDAGRIELAAHNTGSTPS